MYITARRIRRPTKSENRQHPTAPGATLASMDLDPALCRQALLSRDARFDGKFFVAVKTTGIYCRPICPARPKRENVEFFSNALTAEKAGYRPCLRCRPESAPLSPVWIGKSATVQRALQLIAANRLQDTNENSF